MSPKLLKPIHPVHSDVAGNIAFKLTTSAMLLPIWIILIFVMKPTAPTSWSSILLSIPALLIAGVTRFVWQYALAVIAFWTTRVEAINQLYFTLDSFLSGRIAPLALLPGWLGTFAYFAPFRGMGAYPVELFLGRVPAAQVLPGFALQAFWLIVGVVVFRVMWAAGIKQYSAVGA